MMSDQAGASLSAGHRSTLGDFFKTVLLGHSPSLGDFFNCVTGFPNATNKSGAK